MRKRGPNRHKIVAALGAVQILAWGSSFYLPAVVADPIVAETGWPLGWVVGGASVGLLVAGLVSPQVGVLIGKRGGRPVLAASSLTFAAGLVLMGSATILPVYLAAWAIVGVGMGAGLYDAVFVALGRLFGHAARAPMTALTLYGGFASAVCWPLSAYLVATFDWRTTCFVYAALHLLIALPLQWFALRGEKETDAEGSESVPVQRIGNAPAGRHGAMVVLLAAILSIAAGVGSCIVVHLLTFLQARGFEFATAVMIGSLLGPAQVGARLVESLFGVRFHPLWTLIVSVGGMAAGLSLMAVDLPIVAAAFILYSAGYGVTWIARGTVPLAIFGPQRYPRLMGKIALPSLIVQALAPAAAAIQVERQGPEIMVATLAAFTVAGFALAVLLLALHRRDRDSGAHD